METNTATKLERARIILILDDLRKSYIQQFDDKAKLFEMFMGSQGNGELKLLIDKLKTDLLALETKLESLL